MPALRGTLEGAVQAGSAVRLTATVAHTGQQYCVNAETDADLRLAGQTVVGATAQRSWPLAAARAFGLMRIVVGVDNLFDRAIYDQCGLPQAGRTVRIGLDLR
jgi:iron complex outermembrane receptor protein